MNASLYNFLSFSGDVCPMGQYCPVGSSNGTYCPPGTNLNTTGTGLGIAGMQLAFRWYDTSDSSGNFGIAYICTSPKHKRA